LCHTSATGLDPPHERRRPRPATRAPPPRHAREPRHGDPAARRDTPRRGELRLRRTPRDRARNRRWPAL